MKYLILLSIVLPFSLYSAGSKRDLSAFKTGAISIVMTVDWEGRNLEESNLGAMRNFSKKYPGIPVLHFLNAAYYTKPNANPIEITKKIKSVLRPHDEHGLHLHAWKTLVEASGVKFRTKPDLGGWSLRNCNVDCGHVISIEAYETPELVKILNKSIQILTKNGFRRPQSFRSGAWQTGPNVARALSLTGIKMDSSGTVPTYVARSWGNHSILVKSINRLWPNIKSVSEQPYQMTGTVRPLWQVPNNGSLADYTDAETIFEVLKHNVNTFLRNPKPEHYVVIGFHQETAARFLPRVEKALEKIITYSKRKGVPIQFAHLPLKFAR